MHVYVYGLLPVYREAFLQIVFHKSSSSRSPTWPVQQQWWRWWSYSGPPIPHLISGEAELLMATVRFALVGVCYISEEHVWLFGPPHHRDTLGEGTIFSFLCMCVLSLLWPERSRTKTTWPGKWSETSCVFFVVSVKTIIMPTYWIGKLILYQTCL